MVKPPFFTIPYQAGKIMIPATVLHLQRFISILSAIGRPLEDRHYLFRTQGHWDISVDDTIDTPEAFGIG